MIKKTKPMNQILYEYKHPVLTNAECEECGWKGTPSDCKTDWKDDGWENPGYPIAFCPKCKQSSVMWY